MMLVTYLAWLPLWWWIKVQHSRRTVYIILWIVYIYHNILHLIHEYLCWHIHFLYNINTIKSCLCLKTWKHLLIIFLLLMQSQNHPYRYNYNYLEINIWLILQKMELFACNYDLLIICYLRFYSELNLGW